MPKIFKCRSGSFHPVAGRSSLGHRHRRHDLCAVKTVLQFVATRQSRMDEPASRRKKQCRRMSVGTVHAMIYNGKSG